MKSIRFIGLLLPFFLMVACSNDDGQSNVDREVSIPDFNLIGEDGSSIYQYQYSSAAKSGIRTNITQENGVSRQYITIRQTADWVSFFSFANNNFSFVQRNIANGSGLAYPDFYTVSDDRAITWGTNSETEIFLGFYTPRGTKNYNVRLLDPETAEFLDIFIEFGILQAYQPLYNNGRLVMPFRDNASNYKIAVVNTDAQALMQILDFGGAVPSVFIDDIGDMVVISSTDQNNYGYKTYDLQSLDILTEDSFTLNKYFEPGPLEASLSGDKLFYLNYFAQPYPIPVGPAVFDIPQGEDRVIDILSIVEDFEEEKGFKIALTAIRYMEIEQVFLVGYAENGDPEVWRGGVFVITTDGRLVDTIEVDFVPTFIAKP